MHLRRQQIHVNRRRVQRQAEAWTKRLRPIRRADERDAQIPPPSDEIAQKVDEIWPEIAAGIEYLRTR